MKREAFKMYLKPGFEKEYQKRHSEIWPELVKLLKANGVSDYSIFWDKETNVLYAVQKNDGAGSQDMGDNEIVKNGGTIWQISWQLIRIIHLSVFHWKKFFIWNKNINY